MFSRAELETAVWGDRLPTGETLRSQMHILRRAFAAVGAADPVENLHGVGYRLAGAEARECGSDGTPRPASRMSFRRRLALLLCFGVAVLAAQAFVMANVVEQQEEEFINDILDDEMDRVRRRGGGALAGRDLGLITGYVVGSESDRGRVPLEFRDLPEGTRDVFISGREYHVAVRHADGVEYYLAYDVSRHETRIRAIQEALLALIVVSLVALVGVSIWLSGVLARQVGDLARRVDHRTGSATGHPRRPLP